MSKKPIDLDRYRTLQITYTSGQARVLLVSEKERDEIYEAALAGKEAIQLGSLGVLSLHAFRYIQDLEAGAERAKSEEYWLQQAKKHQAETKSIDAEKFVDKVTGREK